MKIYIQYKLTGNIPDVLCDTGVGPGIVQKTKLKRYSLRGLFYQDFIAC